ncbi:hypothetical protein HI113_00275 [Corallococcus exiguus]|uniref:hypothetical protein n=1 Tax=Corallococcus exiguus TaxID=83462 RepID=UPI0014747DE1|nr:hypothetical protein [Corallococcus exiguus]NNB92357.1 hypothetical protein [Corallococcus exiguus]
MSLRFIHARPHTSALSDFDTLLASGIDGLRMSMCFFRPAGFKLLSRHAAALNHKSSFVVVAIDFPTDLDAVARLHAIAPGHVYLHRGFATPEEKKGGGQALMHSKICLTRAGNSAQLWVGSHNLSANALSGANIEAALLYAPAGEDQVIRDAEQHLAECRADAELFDPARIDEYRSVQAQKAGFVGEKAAVLVIHAEEHHPLVQPPPGVIHILFATEEFDTLTKTDTTVHFFVHPPGTLHHRAYIGPGVRRYTGRIIEDNRTELHSGGGSRSTMRNATHWLELQSIPRLVAPNSSAVRAVTQAAILLDLGEARADEFIYSVGRHRSTAEVASTVESLRYAVDETPDDLLQFFTPSSIESGRLVFAPREHVQETARINVFSRTPVPERFRRNESPPLARRIEGPRARARRVDGRVELEISRIETTRPIDSYFFKSTFRISSDDDRVD